MKTLSSLFRLIAPAAALAAGALFTAGAQAHGINWSVGVALPVPGMVAVASSGGPGVVYAQAPVYAPAPVYQAAYPAPVYQAPAYQAPRVVYSQPQMIVEPGWRGEGWHHHRHHHHHEGWERGGYHGRPGY